MPFMAPRPAPMGGPLSETLGYWPVEARTELQRWLEGWWDREGCDTPDGGPNLEGMAMDLMAAGWRKP